MLDDLTDWRFVVGASIIGYLVLTNWTAFNAIIGTGARFAENYTQILQGRSTLVGQ